jgi:hypothetical protein
VRGGKRGILVELADQNAATDSAPMSGTAKRTASSNNQSVIAQMYALAKEHNELDVQKLIKDLMTQNSQDANSALAQLQTKYAIPGNGNHSDDLTLDPRSEYWAWVNEMKINKTAASMALENASGDYGVAKKALIGNSKEGVNLCARSTARNNFQ